MSTRTVDGYGRPIEATKSDIQKCIEKSGELANLMLHLDKKYYHPSDKGDIIFHIHALQNILYAQAWIERHGKL